MAIGDTMYQFILSSYFKLTTFMLTGVILKPHVRFIHMYTCCYIHYSYTSPYVNIGSLDVNTEAASALNSAHLLNANLTLQHLDNDGASDDRAVKCYISSCYHQNNSRRSVALRATDTNGRHMCIHSYFVINCGWKILLSS